MPDYRIDMKVSISVECVNMSSVDARESTIQLLEEMGFTPDCMELTNVVVYRDKFKEDESIT